MGTHKSKEEINKTLSKIIKKEFHHRGEIADTIGIHTITLNKWVEASDYNWEDFNINYRKSLYKTILDLGGIEYIKNKFEKGYKIVDIGRELNASDALITQTINRILDENNLKKEEIGYKGY